MSHKCLATTLQARCHISRHHFVELFCQNLAHISTNSHVLFLTRILVGRRRPCQCMGRISSLVGILNGRSDLTWLQYQTPAKLRHLVVEVAHQSTSGVDLGCGRTGLSGRAFHDLTTHLVGVDLSPEMIEKAKITGCYTSLHVGDVESILTKGSYIHSARTGVLYLHSNAILFPSNQLLILITYIKPPALSVPTTYIYKAW